MDVVYVHMGILSISVTLPVLVVLYPIVLDVHHSINHYVWSVMMDTIYQLPPQLHLLLVCHVPSNVRHAVPRLYVYPVLSLQPHYNSLLQLIKSHVCYVLLLVPHVWPILTTVHPVLLGIVIRMANV